MGTPLEAMHELKRNTVSTGETIVDKILWCNEKYLSLQKNSVMTMAETATTRLIWVDWMKVWAALAVVWGHFFSEGDVYVFVFNLQVFCVISGFLYKKAPSWAVCLKRCFWQLLVPTVIMSVMMHLEAWGRAWLSGGTYDISWPWFFEWLLLGHRWCMGPCWYFYTLIVIRIIMQMLPERRWAYAVMFAALSAGAIYLHCIGFEVSNANVNVLVCMPFFLIGVFLKPLKEVFCSLHNYCVEVLLLAAGVAGVALCAHYNGYVWMYLNGIGRNYALFILGGMAGTLMLYVVSLWLSRLPWRSMMAILANGTMLIIGLHIIVVRRLTALPDRLWIEDLVASVLIMLLFIPLVRLCERFFPLLLGRYLPGKGRGKGPR